MVGGLLRSCGRGSCMVGCDAHGGGDVLDGAGVVRAWRDGRGSRARPGWGGRGRAADARVGAFLVGSRGERGVCFFTRSAHPGREDRVACCFRS